MDCSTEVSIKETGGHLLVMNEPVEFEQIISSCFATPDQLKHSDLPQKIGWGPEYELITEDANPGFWIEKITPDLRKLFNQQKILLQDTSKFWDNSSNPK